MSCTPRDHQVALEDFTAGGGVRRGFGSCFKRGEGEHLAAKSLEAKRQLIHTNGIWIEVEGIREETAPASRKLAPLSSSQLPSFITQASPRCGSQLAHRIPSHARNMLRHCCLPSALQSCALVSSIRDRVQQQKTWGVGGGLIIVFLTQLDKKIRLTFR